MQSKSFSRSQAVLDPSKTTLDIGLLDAPRSLLTVDTNSKIYHTASQLSFPIIQLDFYHITSFL